MIFSKNPKDASGTTFSWWKHGDKNTKRSGNQNVATHMGPGGFSEKHGVAILLDKRWKRKIIQTKVRQRKDDHHNNQVQSTQDRTDQCVFHHSRYADMHIEKMYKTSRLHWNNKKHIRSIAGDFNAQLGPGIDSERDPVGEHTTGQSNKRGIWMEQWLMIQNYAAFNKTFKKTNKKNNTPPIHEWERETAGQRGN